MWPARAVDRVIGVYGLTDEAVNKPPWRRQAMNCSLSRFLTGFDFLRPE